MWLSFKLKSISLGRNLFKRRLKSRKQVAVAPLQATFRMFMQNVCKNIQIRLNPKKFLNIESNKIINKFLFAPSIFRREPLFLLTLRETKNFHAAYVRLSCARKQLFYLAHVEIS